MLWFGAQGAGVFIPVFHSPDFDLITDLGGVVSRVQVKTSTFFRNGRWEVAVCTAFNSLVEGAAQLRRYARLGAGSRSR